MLQFNHFFIILDKKMPENKNNKIYSANHNLNANLKVYFMLSTKKSHTHEGESEGDRNVNITK